jgi:hypothetical protein
MHKIQQSIIPKCNVESSMFITCCMHAARSLLEWRSSIGCRYIMQWSSISHFHLTNVQIHQESAQWNPLPMTMKEGKEEDEEWISHLCHHHPLHVACCMLGMFIGQSFIDDPFHTNCIQMEMEMGIMPDT